MDFAKKLKAIELRKKGRSYSQIKKIIKVSKSTLSVWLKDIRLSKSQIKRLRKLQATAYLGSKKKQTATLNHHNEIRLTAKKESISLANDPFFIAGLMLYWAEGNKKYGSVQFCNSDPAIIRIMMRWFRKFCLVPENKFRIGLFLHSLHISKDCQEFWKKITDIPLEQFHKPYIKNTIYSSRKNKLYEGTCKIVIHDRRLLSRIIGWKDGIKENFLNTKNN